MTRCRSKKTLFWTMGARKLLASWTCRTGRWMLTAATLQALQLVFYVVGINSSLRKSMGFSATRTARADEIYPLFWEAVRLLEQTCHLKVVASTSDKAPPDSVCTRCRAIQGKLATKPSIFMPRNRAWPLHIFLFCSAVAMAVAKQCFCGTMENISSDNTWDSCMKMIKKKGNLKCWRSCEAITFTRQAILWRMWNLQHGFSAVLLQRSWTYMEERKRKRRPNLLQRWTVFFASQH